MTSKKFQRIKFVFVFVIALTFSQAIILKNFIIPLIVLIASSLILMLLRRQVKEVMADERDYALGGKSALWAIQVYSWTATIFMIVLYSFRDINPFYEPIANTLAFSTCLLMLLYAAIFRYHSNFKFSNKKSIYLVLMVILFLMIFLFSARLFSGEDDYICVNGSWQKHGNPSFPAPNVNCK